MLKIPCGARGQSREGGAACANHLVILLDETVFVGQSLHNDARILNVKFIQHDSYTAGMAVSMCVTLQRSAQEVSAYACWGTTHIFGLYQHSCPLLICQPYSLLLSYY